VLQAVAVGLGAHRLDDDVRTEEVGLALELDHDVVVLVVVDRLRVGHGPRLLEPLGQVVDHDDPAGAHEPR
jgi:hypothetical protein